MSAWPRSAKLQPGNHHHGVRQTSNVHTVKKFLIFNPTVYEKNNPYKYLCVSVFVLANHAVWSAQHEPVCANMNDYKEEADCLSTQIDLKIAKFKSYYLAAQKQEVLYGRTSDELIESQEIWEKYLRKHCDYLYSREQGTARIRDSEECQMRLYDERTHEIWISYLTFLDSSKPVLPDPKK
ncbi:lysozyme inhibitor LprI family protein [Undibacterium oligocarboniphilum]|uniref:DUF1311 domain-containing protein n=1 Tax=Undibacterium oligocarboniphilum TaxID=666702 RepID=A0A850QPL0_9BURK|nr:lysozyme inhibitor LprI family protein [Undibacterium oligocarboniphilum]MBC3870529.1 DUF1311 domain-containing protein [Undibacterium oligocarboniphilum]NVO78670.1 DUF1311 domain-containing protein [Undibacterium oligocarboniphilum]